jgi:ubiquinone/menaquinone biosynthesis C-methylase UbiE
MRLRTPPGGACVQTDGNVLPFRKHSFDAVLLFTLLTCMPMEREQRGLFAEVQRILRPSGLVYISDLLLTTDSRNIIRYQQFLSSMVPTGSFGFRRVWSFAITPRTLFSRLRNLLIVLSTRLSA